VAGDRELVSNKTLAHAPSQEFGAYIMDAILTDKPLALCCPVGSF